MASGDGSADLLALISHLPGNGENPLNPYDRAGRMAVSVHP